MSARAATLTLRVSPEPGEGFASFMDRLAERNRVPLLPLLAHLGVVERLHFKTLPRGYGLVLPGTVVQSIAHAIGREPVDIARTLVSRYDQVAVDLSDVDPSDAGSIRRACAREWVFGAGSNFCPTCLADSPVWNVAWKLPWSCVCTRHRRLLASTCPACGARAGAGRRDGRTVPALPTVCPIPGCCHAPLPPGEAVPGRRATCGFPLALTDTDDVTELPELLDAQRHVDALLAEPASDYTLGSFQRLRSTCALVFAVSELDDLGTLSPASEVAWLAYQQHRETTASERARLVAEGINGLKGPRVRYWQRVPENAALMTAVLPTALRIARDASRDDTGPQQLAPLVARARKRNPQTVALIPNWFSFPPDLAEAWRGLMFATSTRFTAPAATKAFDNGSLLEPRHIPRLIQEETYVRYLEGLCPLLAPPTLRAFASIAIVRSLGLTTWDESGILLGYERDQVRNLVNNAVVKLNRAEARSTFWDRIEAIRHEIAGAVLVDFRERERAFRHWTLIPLEEWTAIRRQTGIRNDRHGARRRSASAWVWARHVGRHWREAPAFGGSADANAREVFRRFEKTLLPTLRPRLVAEQEQLVRR